MKRLAIDVTKKIKNSFPKKEQLLAFKSEIIKNLKFYTSTRDNTRWVVPLPIVEKENKRELVVPESYRKEQELADHLNINKYNIGFELPCADIILYSPFGNIELAEDCVIVHTDNIYLKVYIDYILDSYDDI
jgi:hypothetical protein